MNKKSTDKKVAKKNINKKFSKKNKTFEGTSNIEIKSVTKNNDNIVLVVDIPTADRLYNYALSNKDFDLANYIQSKANWRIDKNLRK